MIPVTKPFLPPKEEYDAYLAQIWERNWLTNNGPLVNELEMRLKKYLSLDHLLFVGNGTIALQLAIKALGLNGEIITTPFSYIATTSSIVWENCVPIFVDIDPSTLNIDPSKIEKAITSETSAILATHVFGNPCSLEVIESIANANGLKVIYDAAHAFGVSIKGHSIFEYGDISTTSFHATKLFQTIEGGGVFTQSEEILRRIRYMRNFGHDGPEKFHCVGINGKNSEFHAAMGLCNLKYIESIISRRRLISEEYDKRLAGLGLVKQLLSIEKDNYNYSYYPVIFESEDQLLRVKSKLEAANIFPRRYFYPSLSSLSYLKISTNCPITESISSRILCLPLFHELKESEVGQICHVLKNGMNG